MVTSIQIDFFQAATMTLALSINKNESKILTKKKINKKFRRENDGLHG